MNYERLIGPGSAPTWEGRSAPSCFRDRGCGVVDPVNKLWDFITLLDDGLKGPRAVSRLMQMLFMEITVWGCSELAVYAWRIISETFVLLQ